MKNRRQDGDEKEIDRDGYSSQDCIVLVSSLILLCLISAFMITVINYKRDIEPARQLTFAR